jgi:hypothetical protein
MATTEMPRLLSSLPIDATVTPLPIEETTPPVTNMNLAIVLLLSTILPWADRPSNRKAPAILADSS